MRIQSIFLYFASILVLIQLYLVNCAEKNATNEVQGRFGGYGGFFGHRRFRRLRQRDYNGRVIFDDGSVHARPDRLSINKPPVTAKADLFPSGCGEAAEITSQRIVGGRPATDHEFPWQVSIQVNHLPSQRGEFSQYCGGAVLNERWVVTAAHCMSGVSINSMKGVIGTNDITDLGPSSSEVFFDKMIVHEKYNDKNAAHKYDNDIALLRTKTQMKLTKDKTVNAICLPKQGQTFSGSVSVSGWGRVAEGGSKSEKLLTVDVPILDGKNCEKSYKTLFKPQLMLCAGELKGGKDSCQADSGGPLVKIQNDKSYLVGIVSFGIGCARRGNPGTYTKVSNYVDWIGQKMRENS